MEKLSALQTAKLLNVSIEKLRMLEKQGVIHSKLNSQGARIYSAPEIERIKSKQGLTLAEEAERVGSGIQQEIVSYVNLHRKLFLFIGSALLGYFTLVVTIAISFAVSPRLTSDFFGYYYRFNSQNELPVSTSVTKGKSVLAAVTGSALAPYETNVLADIIKPAAVVSLIAIKVIDNEKYLEIVRSPVESVGFPQTGSVNLAGENGIDGEDGSDGNDGVAGLDGLTGLVGPSGPSGASGATGSDGADGTSVADILTLVGGIIIRDSTNTTIQLGPGLDGEVLTISAGIPTWESSGAGSAFSALSSGTNTLAAMIVGSGGSLGFSGTGVINASELLGGTWAIPGAIGSTSPNTGAFTTFSSTGTTNLGSETGTVSINSSGTTNIQVAGAGTTGNVQIGAGGAGSATPDLLVMDIKDTAGDPTGTNGAMYYNSSANTFRCFENGAWVDCIGSGTDSSFIIRKSADESLTENTVLQDDDELLFSIGASETWVFQFNLIYTTLATPDIKIAVTAPTGATCDYTGASVDISTSAGSTSCGGAVALTGGTATTNDPLYVYGSVSNGSTAGTVRLQWAQNTSNINATTLHKGSSLSAFRVSGGADLAEVYYSRQPLEPGTVVSIDPELFAGVKSSTVAYDKNLLGVVSTKPGLVIGDGNIAGSNPTFVALVGRVPVKVSTENGTIYPGDSLTSSSVSGVAMKATKSGIIIGTALTSFESEGVGQILMFIKNGSLSGSDDGDALINFLNSPHSLVDSDTGIQAYEVGKESEIETKLISLIKKIIADFFENTVEFFGSVMFHGDVAFLGRPQFDKDTAGHALIKTGENEISLTFQKEYERVPVVNANVNLTDNINLDEIPKFAVYDLSTKGFKIRLSEAAAFDLDFSWIALSANEESLPVSNSSDINEDVTPTPSATPSEITPETLVIPSPTTLLGEEKTPTVIELVSPSPNP